MTRVFILIGFAFIFMHLHATGHISKYINMRYANISLFAMFVLFFLTLYQWYLTSKKDKDGEEGYVHCQCGDPNHSHGHHHEHDHQHDHDHDHGHDHSHGEKTWYGKLWSTVLMVFPIFSVLFIPIATLNSNAIEAKGFNFPILQDKDPSSIHQFLAPNTSYYYGSEDYAARMNKSLKHFDKDDSVVINDKNYLEVMELIYNYPGEFMGKTIEFQGFSYNNKDLQPDQLFLFLFGIVHCLADSGVYGMMVQFPKNMNMPNDQWIQASGKLSTVYYQPFQKNVPVLQVDSWKHISKPAEEYVYKQY
ncbi:TIGR03943 family putative permease subunit [Peribacillus kribbensis]|uniref:TIGR03943 family putative permease subunit n=1 Tax=Peribacillus kribbensis TaxID=356658 RepID=UPI000419C9C6|nr:TIGR03943 family protein [Peribacillus kribbensis]